MSQAQNTTVATVAAAAAAATNAADTATGRRALEAARFASATTARAGNRFVNIALHIAEALANAKPGEQVRIRYETINAATNQKRGATSTGATRIGQWRTGVKQCREYAPELMGVVGAVAYDETGATFTRA